MKKVLITGATGMIGNLVLKHCLEDKTITEVISFSRRSAGINQGKLTEVLVKDFTDLSSFEVYFSNVDIVYYCLGIYTGAVPQDEFKVITYDYTVEFGELLKKNSPHARFCFLSGAGADRKEKSRMIFAKSKGMAENYLFRHFQKAHSFRPGYIYPVEKRKEPNFSYIISRKLYPVFKLFGNNFSIKSTELAKAIFKVGLNGSDKEILENRDIVLTNSETDTESN